MSFMKQGPLLGKCAVQQSLVLRCQLRQVLGEVTTCPTRVELFMFSNACGRRLAWDQRRRTRMVSGRRRLWLGGPMLRLRRKD